MITQFTNETRLNTLRKMQLRAENLGLFGLDAKGTPIAQSVAANLKAALEATPEEQRENNLALGKLFKRAHLGDVDAKSELRELVVEQTQNFVTCGTEWGGFFEMRTLADNQSPAIQNNTKQEISAYYIAQDTGKAELTRVIKPQREATVDLKELVSERVEYMTRDLYTGDVTEAARVMFNISFDLAQQMDKILDPETGFLSAAIGNFALTDTNKAKRVYNAHSRIRSGNLPTRNVESIQSVSGSTKFGYSTLDEAINYCVRFKGTDPLGELMPTGEIRVPVLDVREITSGFNPTGAKQNDIIAQLAQNGWLEIGNYAGINWRIVPSQSIARKSCYFRLNKPVGILWRKPGFDEVVEEVDRMKNLATRQEKMAFGAAIPTPNVVNILKVTYRT